MILEREQKVVHYYLGVDYGASHIGLAIADSETKMAFCYGTISNTKKLVAELLEIVKKEDITKVIIGIPSYINREETEYEAEKLGEYLRNIEQIDVSYQNEMFSTKVAHENLKERGAKNISQLDHEESARVILQSWLDKSYNM